jgi:hypothetical protein
MGTVGEHEKGTKGRYRERLISRRRQGDLGEFSAMEWLASKGALVWVPLGHSPDVDLIAEFDGRLLRVQVKTSTYRLRTTDGHGRWGVSISTNGGNQSWTGTAKCFNPSHVDYLFVLVGDGRRWFIPAALVEAARRLSLGGTKYSEFEVERGQPIEHLVYLGGAQRSDRKQGECLSGQKEQTVNLSAMPTQVRILPPPFRPRPGFQPTRYERALGRSGRTIINQKRRVTLPQQACIDARLQEDDCLCVRSEGDGRIVLERIEPPPAR